MKKKLGRPPSEATQEQRRVEGMLKIRPKHLPKFSESKKIERDKAFAHNEKIRQEILATYKRGRTTPDSHAYAMASIGDESLTDEEQSEILVQDNKFASRVKKYQESGALAVKNINYRRKVNLKIINQYLISKIQPGSRYTLHSVAQMIYKQWCQMTSAQKLPEEKSMQRRGDGNDRPSVSTIRRWIK